jgi:hypothetical protein
MKKTPIVGYVVVAPTRGTYLAAKNSSKEEFTLWFGFGTTIFKSRKTAKTLLERTRKYAASIGKEWPWLRTTYISPVRKFGK